MNTISSTSTYTWILLLHLPSTEALERWWETRDREPLPNCLSYNCALSPPLHHHPLIPPSCGFSLRQKGRRQKRKKLIFSEHLLCPTIVYSPVQPSEVTDVSSLLQIRKTTSADGSSAQVSALLSHRTDSKVHAFPSHSTALEKPVLRPREGQHGGTVGAAGRRLHRIFLPAHSRQIH